MKVLLINPPIRLVDEHPPNFPTGIAIIAAIIREMGHEVKVIDLNAQRKIKEQVKEIPFEDYEIIGLGSLVSTYKYVKWLIPVIKNKNPKAKIIVGNSLAVVDDYLIKLGVDVVVRGEGDETIKEVVKALESKKSLAKIKGITYKKGKNPDREVVKNLDKIPLPAYDLLPTEEYLKYPIDDATANPDMNIIISRGCPYNCNYCYKNFGHCYRLRSVNNVIKEIELLVNKYGVRAIHFVDDNFGINEKWLNEFCDRVKKFKLDWGCMTRVDSPILNDKTLNKMRKAGCKSIGFGLESASDKILKNMNKRVTNKQQLSALRLVKKHKIKADGSWMYGYPGETIETANETINFCLKHGIPLWWGYTTPYPETPLWDWAIKNKKITGNVEEYILKLDDVQSFIVNLTDIPNKEFHKLWENGRRKVNNSFRVKFSRVVEFLKVYGLKKVLIKTLRYLKRNIKQILSR